MSSIYLGRDPFTSCTLDHFLYILSTLYTHLEGYLEKHSYISRTGPPAQLAENTCTVTPPTAIQEYIHRTQDINLNFCH